MAAPLRAGCRQMAGVRLGSVFCRAVGRSVVAALAVALLLGPPGASADPERPVLEQAVDIGVGANAAAGKSQKVIDGLDDETRVMLDEYRSVLRRTRTLDAFNNNLRDLIESQQEEIASLRTQLRDLTVTQQEILPLMIRMIDALERFVALDVPFLPAERRKRVAALRTLMKRADVTLAEKFRRILEAYQVENAYGRTIEAYRGPLRGSPADGGRSEEAQERMVDFLRIGRVGLYYLTLDESESGHWDRERKAWSRLAPKHNIHVESGLRVARKQAAPELLALPVTAPDMQR